jgi:hypothetical protein
MTPVLTLVGLLVVVAAAVWAGLRLRGSGARPRIPGGVLRGRGRARHSADRGTDPVEGAGADAVPPPRRLLGLDPPPPAPQSALLLPRVRWGLAAGVVALGTALVVGIYLLSGGGGGGEDVWQYQPTAERTTLMTRGDPPLSSGEVAPPATPTAVAVDPSLGVRLVAWSGSGQTGEPGRPLRRGLAVLLQDSTGRPMPGAEVRFVAAGGGGRVEPSQVTTSDLGLAVGTWWLGADPDSLQVTAYLESPARLSVEFTAAFDDDGARPRRVAVTSEAESVDAAGSAADAPGVETEVAAEAAPAAAEPVRVPVRTRAAFTAGGVHTCRVVAGEALCWGGDALGSGGRVSSASMPSAPALRVVSAGLFHSCGVTARETVYCWPAGGSGSRGHVTPPRELELPGGATPRDVVAGAEHSCALSADGAVYCWGSNAHGQVGDGTTSDAESPVRVEHLPRVVQLASGWMHTCALTGDGRVYCWGANGGGQIGDGGSGARTRPTPVEQTGTFVQVTAGSAHTCALTGAGRAWCWGSNEYGQLGTGAARGERRPRQVAGDLVFRTVAAGGVHTCALTDEGAAWCWGRNTFGQLGDQSGRDSVRPSRVAGGRTLVALRAGGSHTCGEGMEGQVYCWGNNVQGQVGDGTRNNRSAPVAVAQEERR